MKRTNIGVARIEYNQDGLPVASSFSPEVYIGNHWQGASDALLTGEKVSNADQAKHLAQNVMASWFVHIEGIELADREVATIESEVVQCLKWMDSDIPQVCQIQFFLQTRE